MYERDSTTIPFCVFSNFEKCLFFYFYTLYVLRRVFDVFFHVLFSKSAVFGKENTLPQWPKCSQSDINVGKTFLYPISTYSAHFGGGTYFWDFRSWWSFRMEFCKIFVDGRKFV